MDLSSARRVASRCGLLTHRAAVRLAFQKQCLPRAAFHPSRLGLAVAFAAGLSVFCGAAEAQISLVGVTPCGPASLPGAVCTIPATGSGHLLVVGIQVGSGINTATTISSITDNAGNSYAEASAARSVDTAASSFVDIWYARNTQAGSTQITITPSAGLQNAGIVIWEFAGADPNAPLDQAAALNSQASSPNPAGAPVTTASPNEVVIALAAVAGNISGVSSGSLFTEDASLKGNAWAHLITSSAGTYTPQWVESPAGTYSASTVSFIAAGSQSGVDPCDLNNDGLVNVQDANLAVSMSLGQTPCTANIDGANVCNVVIVQRVVNAANGQACVTGNAHVVTLGWAPSPSPNIGGYNIFRGTVTGGPYTQINSALVPLVAYSDSNVQAGVTYYYVTTAVDINNNSSVYSNEASLLVPSP